MDEFIAFEHPEEVEYMTVRCSRKSLLPCVFRGNAFLVPWYHRKLLLSSCAYCFATKWKIRWTQCWSSAAVIQHFSWKSTSRSATAQLSQTFGISLTWLALKLLRYKYISQISSLKKFQALFRVKKLEELKIKLSWLRKSTGARHSHLA